MANNLFPLISDQATATLTLEIAEDATAKTVEYIVDSRKVSIDAQGADAAPTYTVNLHGPTGLVFFVDVTSLNKRGGDDVAATVKFVKGKNTLTISASNMKASVMLTDEGLQSASDLDLIGVNANSPVFA